MTRNAAARIIVEVCRPPQLLRDLRARISPPNGWVTEEILAIDQAFDTGLKVRFTEVDKIADAEFRQPNETVVYYVFIKSIRSPGSTRREPVEAGIEERMSLARRPRRARGKSDRTKARVNSRETAQSLLSFGGPF